LITTPGFFRRGVVDRITELLAGKEVTVFDRVQPNPSLVDLEAGRKELVKAAPEAVIALGGGSVMDTAKAFSFLLGAGDEFDLIGHLREKTPLPEANPVPWVAVPCSTMARTTMAGCKNWRIMWDCILLMNWIEL